MTPVTYYIDIDIDKQIDANMCIDNDVDKQVDRNMCIDIALDNDTDKPIVGIDIDIDSTRVWGG